MAKWGEGDPRWIVEERPDATNVNNWHWTEKNATLWSKEKMKELLIGLEIKDEKIGSVKLTEFDRLEGEASANNRKAKLIFFFEWDVKIKFKGKRYGNDKEVSGDIKVPNLSDENDADDLDISVHCSGDSAMKEMVKTVGVPLVREKLKNYMDSLRLDFAKDMILPTKDEANGNVKNVSKAPYKPKPPGSDQKLHQPMERLGLGAKLSTGEVTERISLVCAAPDLYRALTEKELLVAFTGGNVEVDAQPGGKFSLFGGHVQGTFVELTPNKQIKQKWRFKTWPEGHYSDVTIDIGQKEGTTQVVLTQKGVPITDLERTKNGWERYYWTAMKRTFGFGSFLM